MFRSVILFGGLVLAACLIGGTALGAVSMPAATSETSQSQDESHGANSHGSGSLDNSDADTWGYVYRDNVSPDTATFSWIELRGDPNTEALNHWSSDHDNSYCDTLKAIGFSFPFYGVSQDSFTLSTNGTITFCHPIGMCEFYTGTNAALPALGIGAPAIFPFWDELHLDRGGLLTDQVLLRRFGAYTVIQYTEVGVKKATCGTGAPTNRLTFEVVLFSDGRIKMQYLNVDICDDGDSSMTVGIQASGSGPALEYCSGTVAGTFTGHHPAAGLAVWYYPANWIHNFATLAITSPAPGLIVNPNVQLNVTATFSNIASAVESAPVKYSFDGGATVSEATALLSQGQSETHAFTTPFTTPALGGTYTLAVWSDLATDEHRGNDTVRSTIVVKVGSECGNEVILTGDGPDSAIFNNCGMGSGTPGVNCSVNSYQDMVFKKTVEPEHTVAVWLSSVSWLQTYVDMAMRWGGACPGANIGDCFTASTSPGYTHRLIWKNTTGSPQTVYVVIGSYNNSGSSGCGNFRLNWQDQVCAAVDAPFSAGFEGTTTNVLPDCWTPENVDGLMPAWESYGSLPHGGTRCATITAIDIYTPVNDWLFSPGITLEEGRYYNVSYWRRVTNVNRPDSIEIRAGAAPTAGAMSISVAPVDTCKSTAYVQKFGGFTCPSSGVYYIGWHAMNKGIATNTRTYIDDISVAGSDSCTTPVVTAYSAAGADSVTLSTSVAGGSGGIRHYQWYTGSECLDENAIVGARSSTYTTYVSGVFSCRVYILDPLECVSCDSAAATVYDCITVTPTPIGETFENSAGTMLPGCWTAVDLDSNSRTWQTDLTLASHTGIGHAYDRETVINPANDWMFSRPISLVGGQVYHVNYWYRQAFPGGGFTEALEVLAGLLPTAASMTMSVDPNFNFSNITNYVQHQSTFTAPASAIYYFGWHCRSNGGQRGILVDDIEIYRDGECIAPTVTVAAVASADSVVLTAQIIGGVGGPVQYQWFNGTRCDGGNAIVGATSSTYTALVTGSYSCQAYCVSAASCADCDSAYATVLGCETPVTLPLSENFNATSDPAPMPGCWTYADSAGTNAHWTTSTAYARSGRSASIAYPLVGQGALNDWLFSRGFSCTAGDTVIVDYWYRMTSTPGSYADQMEVKAGTGNNVAAMTIAVDPLFQFSNSGYLERTPHFVAPTTGIYYIGWHALSGEDASRGIGLDDIQIYRFGTCAPPTAVTVEAATGQSFVTLTCNVTGGFGGLPQYRWYTGSSCATGTPIPGATASTYAAYVSGVYSCKAWFVDAVSCGGCDSAAATVLPDPCLPGLVLPPYVIQDFSGSSMPACWSEENVNNDGYVWANAGSSYAALNTDLNPANDWLISAPYQLTGGTPYQIEYQRWSAGAGNPQTIALAAGTVRHSSTMNSIVLAPYSFNNTSPLRDIAVFTPAATGSYYFGIHCTTTPAGGGVRVDDFVVYPQGACSPPTSVTVNSVVDLDSATLVCNAAGGFGAEYSYQWYSGAVCDPMNAIPGATEPSFGTTVSGTFACKVYIGDPETCGLCDSATATVFQCAANPVTTWPYIESFEGHIVPLLPDCWRQQDVNGDGLGWEGSWIYPRTGARSAFCQLSAAGTFRVNDWLFSKPVHFTAGDTMVVEYWFRQYQPGVLGEMETMEVRAGFAPRDNAMEFEIDPEFNFGNTSYDEHVIHFIVPVTGNYYFGWHGTSGIWLNGILVDDVTIYPYGFCTAPTVSVPNVTFPDQVILTATALGGIGEPIQCQWYSGTVCTPATLIAGATSPVYTTTVSGTYTCKAWRTNAETCAGFGSGVATVLVPQAGETCTNPITLTPPASGTQALVAGSTAEFYPSCTVTCGTVTSGGPDVFYSLTLTGQPQFNCRRIAFALTDGHTEDAGDMQLMLFEGAGNCCSTPLLCNDNDLEFTNRPGWDVLAQHPGGHSSYIAAELEPGTYLIRIGYAGMGSGTYALTVYDNGSCYEPCIKATNVTVYLNPSSPTHAWLNFTAPSGGSYKVYSTAIKGNDGDPRDGDPQWTLEATLPVAAAGAVQWTDSRVTDGYRNYVVIHDCPILGRCCYGNPQGPSCTDNAQAECLALSGSWNRYARCATDPCPWVQPAPGEFCLDATLLEGPLPIIAMGSTTNHVNNLDWYVEFPNPAPTPDCWQVDFVGTSNLQGPDVWWQWVVPATGLYNFNTCPTLWNDCIVLFDYTCPTPPTVDNVICGNDDGGPGRCQMNPASASLQQIPLVAGQHILIDVDGFAPADSGNFTLTISAD